MEVSLAAVCMPARVVFLQLQNQQYAYKHLDIFRAWAYGVHCVAGKSSGPSSEGVNITQTVRHFYASQKTKPNLIVCVCNGHVLSAGPL